MQIEDYVTKPELARHLRVSVRTVDNMMARHDIPYVLIGRLVRFKITEVDQSLEQKYRLNSAWE
jgi:excisionase family DNA binding protein